MIDDREQDLASHVFRSATRSTQYAFLVFSVSTGQVPDVYVRRE